MSYSTTSTNCEITEQSAVRGGRHKNKGYSVEKLISPGASDEERKRRRRERNEWREVGLESCFSFCPDIFAQKHPSGAVVIMEHKIA